MRVAGDGGGLDEARAAAAAAGGDAIDFVGRITHAEVGRFLAGVDLGYSGQRAEPGRQMYHSPLKLAEYMAAGLPVLASRYPDSLAAAAGVAEDLLFEPGSTGGLELALAWAWQHRADLPAIGMAMRRRAERRLGWNGRVEVLLSTLRSRGLLR
ncbi:MAG TPA: hypothetical protein DCS97_10390 [Planctomycetes bacterium]|nr:hypothetical protein [Planctomycetota bacterium]